MPVSDGWVHNSSGQLFICNETGVYSISCNISFILRSGNNVMVSSRLNKNGTPVPYSQRHALIPRIPHNDVAGLTLDCEIVENISAGDIISVHAGSSATSTTIAPGGLGVSRPSSTIRILRIA